MNKHNGTIAIDVGVLYSHFVLLLNMKLIKPESSNKTENTIPIAMALVTYGKKNTVCKNFWNALIELSKTEINNAKAMETGTVTNVKINVFGIALDVKLDSKPGHYHFDKESCGE